MGDEGLYAALVRRGMSRRTFLRLSAATAAALALPASYARPIAAAIEQAPRVPVIWLRGQSCGGNTEALLRAPDPTAAQLLLEVLAVDYHETLMAPAGADAELARQSTMERFPDGYLVVLEGAMPRGNDGACLVGGRPFADVAREVCDGALATIAVGSCAFDGGASGAIGAPTDAEGVRSLAGSSPLVALPGCPVNGANLAATIVHWVTFGSLPPADLAGRPLAFYGPLIHNECERRPHFEFGEFALAWGDEGAQKGWCLYKLGCKGPETMANCPTVRYGAGVSWNVRAGHGCIGCTMPAFWDSYGPAYVRLPSPVPFMPAVTADMLGVALVGGIGAVAVAHGTGMAGRSMYRDRKARRAAEAAAIEGAEAATPVEAVHAHAAVAMAVAPDPAPEPTSESPGPVPDAPDAPDPTAPPATSHGEGA
jgi:hydrogenase small subunit